MVHSICLLDIIDIKVLEQGSFNVGVLGFLFKETFFWMDASLEDAVAANLSSMGALLSNGLNMFLANVEPVLNNRLRYLPRSSPNPTILDVCFFDEPAELFEKCLRIFAICVSTE